MSTGSADYFRFRGAFEGSIPGHDSDFNHRPYHKNCRCALHDKPPRSGRHCSHAFPPRCNTISYPIRRSRSEGSIALVVPTSTVADSSPVNSNTPCSSPMAAALAAGTGSSKSVKWENDAGEYLLVD